MSVPIGFVLFHCLAITGSKGLETGSDLGLGDRAGVIVCLECTQRVGVVDIEHVRHGRLVIAPPAFVIATEGAPVLDGHLQGQLAQVTPFFASFGNPGSPNGSNSAGGRTNESAKKSSGDCIEVHVVLLWEVVWLVAYVVTFFVTRWIILKVSDRRARRRARFLATNPYVVTPDECYFLFKQRAEKRSDKEER